MSDATFRLHDWNRLGADGKPRPLHIAESLESIDFEAGPIFPTEPTVERIKGGTLERLARSDYFSLERLTLTGSTTIGEHDRFTILLGIEGEVDVHSLEMTVTLELGQTLLLPASIGPCEVNPRSSATLLTCVVP